MRLAVRALILRDNRLLLVNAYGDHRFDLWCAPGGGVEPHQSLPDNLAREVYEETGLTVEVGAPALVNEFHAPDRNFHQVEVFFRCHAIAGELDENWRDPEGIVHHRRYFSRAELADTNFKPKRLIDAAWGSVMLYDPLETMIV